jgi:hypothetical protein
VSVYQRRRFPHSLKGLFLCAAIWALWSCAAAPVFAQNLTTTSVEMWYGMRRVDVPAKARTQDNPHPDPVSRPAPALMNQNRIVVPVSGLMPLETSPSAQLPVVVTLPPLETPPAPGMVQASHVVIPAESSGPSTPLAQSDLAGNALRGDVAPAPANQTAGKGKLEQSAVAGDHFESPPPTADRGPGQGLYHFAVAQLIFTLVSVIAGPLLAVVAFCVLLRRHSARHGPSFHLEFPAAQHYGPAVPSVSPPSTSRADAAPPAAIPTALPAEPESKVEAFGLQATFADVFQQKHDAPGQPEEGILRHLVAQNRKLMEQIGELETVAHP